MPSPPEVAPMLVLHHAWASTCSQKVRLCLAEKQLDYDSRLLNLRRFEQLDPAFLALNPDGYVPVLEDDGFVLTESTLINDYLDERFPKVPLRPADARGRATVAAWSRFIDDVTSPAIKLPSFQQNMRPFLLTMAPGEVQAVVARMPNAQTAQNWREAAGDGIAPHRLAQAQADLRRSLERMEAALAHGPWLAGATYTLADVNMAPFVNRLTRLPGYDLPRDWPRVDAWWQRLRERPAFARAGFVEQVATRDQRAA